MSNIVTFEKNLPMKAYKEKDIDTFLDTQFKYFIATLLSLKADKEDEYNASKIAIKQLFWSMGLNEIKKCFTMYALGQLNLEPIQNHFSIILVGKIHSAYKDHVRANDNKPRKTEEQLKEEFDDIQTIMCFDQWKHDGKVADEFVWVYAYLEKKKLIEYSAKEKKTKHAICVERFGHGSATDKAKIMLIEDYFARINAKGNHIKEFL